MHGVVVVVGVVVVSVVEVVWTLLELVLRPVAAVEPEPDMLEMLEKGWNRNGGWSCSV